jgi:putative nucleotidyltransferase with HDIG domain
MSGTKRISIEQLIPGMFVVEMDLPWYQTPFLFHKRLIRDVETIGVMKQHGVQSVTIDTAKGLDVQESPVTPTGAPALSLERQDSALPAGGMSLDSHVPTLSDDGAQAVAASVYTEAQESMERIFADLERGVPPTPAVTKAIVGGVIDQVLHGRSELLLHSTFLKVKQFDRSLGAHALDTAILSLVVAVESGVDPALYEHLGMGALLHDVGYVRLPRNLVRKRDECNDSEQRLLEQHTQLGTAVLGEQSGFHQDVCRIVVEHHERCDGSGYPRKVKAQDISPLAQIVGIVDLYDKMVSRRGGRPAMIPHDAVRQLFLVGERGQYPKPLVEAVIRSIGVYPVGSLVRLNTGEQAVVVGVNSEQRLKPRVKITGGPHGESYPNPEQIDLSLPSQDKISRTVLRVLDPVQERVNIAMYLSDATDQAA